MSVTAEQIAHDLYLSCFRTTATCALLYGVEQTHALLVTFALMMRATW